MRKEIAMKWVDALRSGAYKQTDGQLRNEDGGFCCLGVLCNIHAQEHPEIAASQTDPLSYLESSFTLPVEVRKWAGLASDMGQKRNGEYFSLGGLDYQSLAAANDSGVPFDKIASWVKKNYKEL